MSPPTASEPLEPKAPLTPLLGEPERSPLPLEAGLPPIPSRMGELQSGQETVDELMNLAATEPEHVGRVIRRLVHGG